MCTSFDSAFGMLSICLFPCYTCLFTVVHRVVPDFGSSSGKSEIQPFFGNPAKSGYGHISSWIWRMPVQLQYLQLFADKTNTVDLSSGVFTILVSVTRMKNTKFIAIPQISSKTGKQ